MQNFFFIGKNELQDNIFSEDLKIANFWQKIGDGRKNDILQEPLKKVIKDLMVDYTDNHKPCANIRESDGEDDSKRSSSNCSKSDYDRLEYEEALLKLKTPVQLDAM